MRSYFIGLLNFKTLVEKLTPEFSILAPKREYDYIHLVPLPSLGPEVYTYNEVRSVQPWKTFFFRPRERVATYLPSKRELKKELKFLLFGAKACDLKSLEILDKVFLSPDLFDPYYESCRKNSFIIGSDCLGSLDSCFCTLVGLNPYPEGGFDLNLSPSKEGYIVEVGSEKGEKLRIENENLFQSPSEEQLEFREKNRKRVREEVVTKNQKHECKIPYPEILRKRIESGVWNELVGSCVECNACLKVCPTCQCFLLYDQKGQGAYERIRVWDDCMYPGFARVAAGLNPRPRQGERVRYRYLHKFDFFWENYRMYMCSGCGRCIEACPGRIDIREVFKKLDAEISS